MFNPMSVFFLIVCMISVVVAPLSESYLMMWVMLELNMISFICFFSFNQSFCWGGEGLQYFFIQSPASMVFFAVLSFGGSGLGWVGLMMMVISMILKLGVAPLHFWFFNIILKISWGSFYILSTIQKIIPIVILGSLCGGVVFFSVVTSLVGLLGSLKSSSLKFMLGYSSLFSMGWVLGGLGSMGGVLMFFFFYSLSLMVYLFIVASLCKNSYFHLGSWKSEFSFLIGSLVSLLSMGGFPPFLGFWGKIVVFLSMSKSLLVLGVFLVVSSSVILLMYLRMIFMGWSSFYLIETISPKLGSLNLFLSLLFPVFLLI